MTRLIDITGHTYGRLTVLRYEGSKRWLCACTCGATKTAMSADIRSGNTSSCGCYHKEVVSSAKRTHGFACRAGEVNPMRASEYRVWCSMKNRCLNPKAKSYARYGGRGVRVFPAWIESFAAFISYLGPRPSTNHSLDRVENDGHYWPGNVRWATVEQQANNKSGTVYLTYKGKTQSIALWCIELGLTRPTVYKRAAKGWPVHAVLGLPEKDISRAIRRRPTKNKIG